ncbi:Eukaryotic aspartyl protease family protein, partial [Zostera marina]
VDIENINFGCSHESKGTFQSSEAGLIGLSRGPLSLISQLGDRIDKKFSYCLLPYSFDSRLSSTFTFGSSAIQESSNMVKVPIYQSQDWPVFYMLNLESITVVDTTVSMVNAGSVDGNIIIDSGTTLTVLPTIVVDSLIYAVSKVVSLPPAKDPEGVFELCFSFVNDDHRGELPELKLDFGNGKVITLPPSNTFIMISDSVTCLAVDSSGDSGQNFLGNIAQRNFRIEYDVGNNWISFDPVDCRKF